MRRDSERLILSASDLSNFLNCRHLTALQWGEALRTLQRPRWTDPLLQALFARGLEHERSYVAGLKSEGKTITDLSARQAPNEAIAATLEAMRAGSEVIVQGAVGNEYWYGRTDVLLRVDTPSSLRAWSYQVVDTNLATETRAGTIIQLGLYCDLLTAMQSLTPEHFHVVTPDRQSPFNIYRTQDYAAYFRLIKRKLEQALKRSDVALAEENYPERVDNCDVCVWSSVCSKKRRRDDHLSLVAGITRIQRDELQSHSLSCSLFHRCYL